LLRYLPGLGKSGDRPPTESSLLFCLDMLKAYKEENEDTLTENGTLFCLDISQA